MSFSNNSQGVELRALVPPEFDSRCSRCGVLKKLLPWQISTASHWGPCCAACGKLVLRNLLPDPFTEAELLGVLCDRGLSAKEAELLLGDFEEEGFVLRTRTGLFWHEASSEVIQPLIKRKPRHVFRKKTAKEIFGQCVKLSREVRSREEKF